jgi:hypothetical protein
MMKMQRPLEHYYGPLVEFSVFKAVTRRRLPILKA